MVMAEPRPSAATRGPGSAGSPVAASEGDAGHSPLGWLVPGAMRSPRLHGRRRESGIPMTKADFLTVRWNNLLMLGLGLPTLALVVVAFSTSSWSGRDALIALSVLGGFF